MTKREYDVVIVGRGPVGTFLAGELLAQGLSVLLVERRSTPEPRAVGVGETRAFVVHCRSLEIFKFRGMFDELEKSGVKSDWWHFGVLPTRLDYSVFGDESRQNFVLLVPQYRTEEIFLERARKLGVEIVLGTAIESMEVSENSATVFGTTKMGDKEVPFQATGKYVVGADGWKSSVRKAAGIAFPGTEATHSGMTGEARIAEPMPNPFIVHNGNGLVISADLGIPSGRHRLGVFTTSRAKVNEDVPVDLADFNEAYREVTGVDYKMTDPCMIRRFHNEARCAETYRKDGRVLLVGDAGHQHLPAGGQGLNLGLQEAINLGWKLAAVLQGYAPDSLLDTYEAERRPVALGVVENTTAQSIMFFAATSGELANRTIVNKLLQVPEANKMLARIIGCFGIEYPKPLDMVLPAGWEVLPESALGKRALDVKLKLGNGEESWLSDLTASSGVKWTQLRFLDKVGKEAAVPAFPGRTEVIDVAEILEGRADEYKCGMGEMLIRPDLHLAFGRR
jgi:2-polyprenyl-6-methoxyphenol hydroxylase-like FAD-dependent oxidoreductase